MGQQQGYLRILSKDEQMKYQITNFKNIFKKKSQNSYIFIRQYPCFVNSDLIQYYLARKKFISSQSQQDQHIICLHEFSNDKIIKNSTNNGCSPFTSFDYNTKINSIAVAHEYHPNRLDNQITNRHQIPFSQQQIWSVLCCCVKGGYDLVKNGFKEPILSPRGIIINDQGFVKVGEWEFVNLENTQQQGQIILTDNFNEKKSILTRYYWAPEGSAIIEETISLGNRRKHLNKFKISQIFSLGMTILEMCLLRPLYQLETYSEKQIETLMRLAIDKRKYQKRQLSTNLCTILKRMLVWDYRNRINYEELYQTIVNDYKNHLNLEEVQEESFQNTLLGATLEVGGSGTIDQGNGDEYLPQEQDDAIIDSQPSYLLLKDEEQIQLGSPIIESKADQQKIDEFQQQLVTDCSEGQYLKAKNFFSEIEKESGINFQEFNKQSQQSNTFCLPLSENNNSLNNENIFTDPKILAMIRQIPSISKNYPIQSSNFISNDNYHPQQHREFSLNQNSRNWPSLHDSALSENLIKETFAKGFYEGQKQNSMRNGYGVFYYQEGGKYEGQWFNNKMHGKGTLYYPDNKIAYTGQWREDQLHGLGILYNENPLQLENQLYNYHSFNECEDYWISYNGEFVHDDKHGKGTLLFSNGQKFIGQFIKDMANGVGKFYKKDGTIIKGQWKQNYLVKTFSIDSQ